MEEKAVSYLLPVVIPGLVACPHIHCGSLGFVVSRNATMADLRLVPAACLSVTGRGKEDLDLVLLLNQPQHISSLVHLQFHL